jgi:CubicO group peptidase (beta-lactamase class C family)
MKLLKKVFIVFVSLILLLEIYLVVSGNWHVNKVLAMTIFRGKTGPDIFELQDFPSRKISAGNPQSWPKSSKYSKVHPSAELLSASAGYQTTALCMIQNDSLVYEEYWEGTNEHSLSNSFSMAKSFTSILIGIALKDGLIKSLDEPVGNYIEEFKAEAYKDITIKHLLWMGSGLDFHESYGSPIGWPAKAYYGTDVNATVLKSDVSQKTGTHYNYKGGDTQLLGIIIKKVTGKNVAEYASEKLWKKIGAEDDSYWSLDTENGMEKVSCCYYASARDFARFGSLFLKKGNWNGEQIVDRSFVEASIKSSPLAKQDETPVDNYGYQWWIANYKGEQIFYARGILGQYIFVIPSKNIIMVRLGHKRASKSGDELPKDGYTYLDMVDELAN